MALVYITLQRSKVSLVEDITINNKQDEKVEGVELCWVDGF